MTREMMWLAGIAVLVMIALIAVIKPKAAAGQAPDAEPATEGGFDVTSPIPAMPSPPPAAPSPNAAHSARDIESEREELAGMAGAVGDLLKIRAIQHGLNDQQAHDHTQIAVELFADTIIELRSQAQSEGRLFQLETATADYVEAQDRILQGIARHYAAEAAATYANIGWSQPGPPAYTVPLVGEQHYQKAVTACRAGDPVQLLHEPDNPYDSEAIVAVSSAGETLGYVPRDNWLRAAVSEGKGAMAKVGAVDVGQRGFTEILLDVTLVHGSATLGTRAFQPAGSA